jgi:hypothetical protein
MPDHTDEACPVPRVVVPADDHLLGNRTHAVAHAIRMGVL